MNKFLLTLLLAVALSTGAGAQALWQGTEYGMTVDQVSKAVPGAVPPDKGNRLGDGSLELLQLPKIELVGKPFQASFFFKDERLVQVTLTLTEKLRFNIARISAYDSLLQALRVKYGPELSSTNNSIGTSGSIGTSWMSGRTNISLLLIGIADNPAFLNVNYQVRVAKEADKL